MGCFFAQNLTVFEKPKPKGQCERDAAKPSVFAARLRAGVHKGTDVGTYDYEGYPRIHTEITGSFL
jgi:hypothetical protein